MRRENGITLIALIITIIILVILAAVSIRAVYEMGIVNHAVNGTQKYASEAVKENQMLDSTTTLMENTIAKLGEIQNGTGSSVPDITTNKWKIEHEISGEKSEIGRCTFDDEGNVHSVVLKLSGGYEDAIIGTYVLQGNNLVITFDGTEEANTYEWDGQKFTREYTEEYEEGETITITETLTEFIPVTFTFTVDGTEYTAEQGMTWGQWVGSALSTDEFSYNDSPVKPGTPVPVYKGENKVKDNTEKNVYVADPIESAAYHT